MITFVIRRVLVMIPTLFAISVLTFIIIQLPPGDYLETYISNLTQTGESVDAETVASLKQQYGLDRPVHYQYGLWMWNILRHGDMGISFSYNKSVNSLIGERLALTVAISLATLVLTWIIAIPIGIYSATRQYTVFDYLVTFFGFIGMSTPGFLLALLLMSLSFRWFGTSPGGLFSPAFQDAPWTLAKLADLMQHLWVPVVILSVAGTASIIRMVRANLLDQLQMPYVVTARAKGLSEIRLLLKYPVRVAINPVVSTIGWLLPAIISGSLIVEMVLNLPTIGPLLYRALLEQDMFLAGGIVMMAAVLTVIGTLISDLLLAWVDPRIRFERQQS